MAVSQSPPAILRQASPIAQVPEAQAALRVQAGPLMPNRIETQAAAWRSSSSWG